jgi:2,5-diamino-6-(ribosylamino)-4(3H)-pyrimidinone 5'-phosphate reductase
MDHQMTGEEPDRPDRPWICVNFAMSADGKLALPDATPMEISSEEDMLRVHQMRASSDAILVGVSTIVADDPKLHVSPTRISDPPALLKVILDSSGRTPTDACLFDSPGKTLIATVDGTAQDLIERLGDCADVVPFGPGPMVHLPGLVHHLANRGVEKLMVEGGGETIWSFVSSGLVDEVTCYVGPMVIGGGLSPTPADGPGAEDLSQVIGLELLSAERLGEGVWMRYRVTGRP